MSTLNTSLPESVRPPGNICRRVLGQYARIRVPLTVTPQVSMGTVSTSCSGPPIIVSTGSACGNNKNQSCRCTLIQDVRISVPVEFGADAVAGPHGVQCGIPIVMNNNLNESDTLEVVYSDTEDIPFDPLNCLPPTAPLKDKML